MTLLNNRYATGASEIAVPGWPLPTFSTASAARTRAVFTAFESSSDHWNADKTAPTLLAQRADLKWIKYVGNVAELVGGLKKRKEPPHRFQLYTSD
jgi:hypothetical protein